MCEHALLSSAYQVPFAYHQAEVQFTQTVVAAAAGALITSTQFVFKAAAFPIARIILNSCYSTPPVMDIMRISAFQFLIKLTCFSPFPLFDRVREPAIEEVSWADIVEHPTKLLRELPKPQLSRPFLNGGSESLSASAYSQEGAWVVRDAANEQTAVAPISSLMQ